jgi:hypothetical protein
MLGPLGSAMALVATVALPGPGKAPAPGGLVPIPGMAQPYTELKPDMPADASAGLPSGIGSALSALSGLGSGKTEGGKPTTGGAVHVGELNVHVVAPTDGDAQSFAAKLGPAVRAEVQKIFDTHG